MAPCHPADDCVNCVRAGRVRRPVRFPVTRYQVTGSKTPSSSHRWGSSQTNTPPRSLRVLAETLTELGGVMASNCPATTMASPMAVRFSPMRTKPVAIAVRPCKGSPDGDKSSPTRATRSRLACTARSASSSWLVGYPNNARIPSTEWLIAPPHFQRAGIPSAPRGPYLCAAITHRRVKAVCDWRYVANSNATKASAFRGSSWQWRLAVRGSGLLNRSKRVAGWRGIRTYTLGSASALSNTGMSSWSLPRAEM